MITITDTLDTHRQVSQTVGGHQAAPHKSQISKIIKTNNNNKIEARTSSPVLQLPPSPPPSPSHDKAADNLISRLDGHCLLAAPRAAQLPAHPTVVAALGQC